MKRTLVAFAALAAACTPPATGYQAQAPAAPSTSTTEDARPAPTTTEPNTTTSSTTTTTEVSLPPPPTTIAPPPPAAPPQPVDASSGSSGASGTTSASWYGAESGAHTANGDVYDPEGLTFAHRSLAFGTRVRFCRNGSCVVARCTDRGPESWTGRDFDLSEGTFAQLAPLSAGVATVTWAVVG